MTTPGDPHRPYPPYRREGGEDRPHDPGERRPAPSPDDPTIAMPRVTPDPEHPGTWVAGPRPTDRTGAAGRSGVSGPAHVSGLTGATAYSVDSPDLFPPLPEPEPRRPVTPPGPRTGFETPPGSKASRRREASRTAIPGRPEAGGRWGEIHPAPEAGDLRVAGPRNAAGAWRGEGPPPFAWSDDTPGLPERMLATGGGEPGPGDERPSPGGGESRWHEGYGPGGPTGHPPGGYPGGPYGPWPPQRRKGTGAATTSLVLGIASLLLLFVCGIGVVTALVGLVVGIVALARGAARGRALAGLILSALTLLIAASFAAWLASTGVTRCFDETLYPSQGDLEACLEERLGVPVKLS